MSIWGRIIGGVAGFAMGGPFGAVVGAALGHAAENGGFSDLKLPNLRMPGAAGFGPARMAAFLARRDQLFAISVVVLAAKLAKVDGPVVRAEIDAFKRAFRIPAESVRDVGRLFDQAKDSPAGYQGYADQLGSAFADNLGMLEDVLSALFAIARADKTLTVGEQKYLENVWRGFGLDVVAWERASGTAPPRAAPAQGDDPYAVLGVSPSLGGEEIRAAWKQLVRDNHPDGLAGRGVPAEFVARASDKVARINAAWDRIKRERGL